jgi:hypothetical protein
MAAVAAIKRMYSTTEHPSALPTARWRPERVNGMPICRESLPFAAEIPMALFHEKENP